MVSCIVAIELTSCLNGQDVSCGHKEEFYRKHMAMVYMGNIVQNSLQSSLTVHCVTFKSASKNSNLFLLFTQYSKISNWYYTTGGTVLDYNVADRGKN